MVEFQVADLAITPSAARDVLRSPGAADLKFLQFAAHSA